MLVKLLTKDIIVMNRTRRNWTAEEDELLRKSVQNELDNKRPLLWRELAKHIPGRSNKDCRKRWWNSLAGSTAKGPWSADEDRRLMQAVEKYGTNSWMKVAGAVGTRYGDQCSSHWLHVLNPNINYSDWTAEEDERLLDAVQTYGTNWSTIASFHTPERTSLALKNQYWKLWQRSQKANKTSSTKRPRSEKSPPATAAKASSDVTPKRKQAKETTRRITPSSSGDEREHDSDDDEDDDVEMMGMGAHHDEGDLNRSTMDMGAFQTDDFDFNQPSSHNWLGDDSSGSSGRPSSQRKLSSPRLPTPQSPLWARNGGSYPKVPPAQASISVPIASQIPSQRVASVSASSDAWLDGLIDPRLTEDTISTGSDATSVYSTGQQQDPFSLDCTAEVNDEATNMYYAVMGDMDIFQQQQPFDPVQTAAPMAVAMPAFPTTVDMLTPVSPTADQTRPGSSSKEKQMLGLSTTADEGVSLSLSAGDGSSKSPPRRKSSETLSHSVSIELSCTTGQLSNIMSLIASTGLPVNMKIDAEV